MFLTSAGKGRITGIFAGGETVGDYSVILDDELSYEELDGILWLTWNAKKRGIRMDDEKMITIPRTEEETEQLKLEFTKRYMEIDGKVADKAISMIIEGLVMLSADVAIVNHVMIDLANEITAVEDLAD